MKIEMIAEDLRKEYQECQNGCLICRLIERTSRAEAAVDTLKAQVEQAARLIAKVFPAGQLTQEDVEWANAMIAARRKP